MLSTKKDFAVVIRVNHANPNGDPLNGNRPRQGYDNMGEITDVCIKRKLRNLLQEAGQDILIQSDDRRTDDARSIKERVDKVLGKALNSPKAPALACEKWYDVRAFGALLPFKAKKKTDDEEGEDSASSVSIGIRGPVTVQSAFSVEPVEIVSTQITKSTNAEGDGSKRGIDTMGMKHRIDHGVYVFFGSMNPQLSEKTGFSDADADLLFQVLPKMFENDESSARPAGSMEVLKVVRWNHNCKAGQYPSAKVHRTLTVNPDGTVALNNLPGLEPEVTEGF